MYRFRKLSGKFWGENCSLKSTMFSTCCFSYFPIWFRGQDFDSYCARSWSYANFFLFLFFFFFAFFLLSNIFSFNNITNAIISSTKQNMVPSNYTFNFYTQCFNPVFKRTGPGPKSKKKCLFVLSYLPSYLNLLQIKYSFRKGIFFISSNRTKCIFSMFYL